MARKATSKASKKRNRRRPASRRKAEPVAPWQKGPWAFDPAVIYAYHLRAGGEPSAIAVAWLPELISLQVKACQYFGIDARPGARVGASKLAASRETLKLFFAEQRLLDGSPLTRHQVETMLSLCAPSPGGRKRKGRSALSFVGDLHEDQSAYERERILLRMLGEEPQERPEPPSDASPEGKNS